MYTQTPKQVVDIGEIGNASTGDILYDGGAKINDNFDAVYNQFGDQRYFAAAAGSGNQKIYATGYYQKLSAVNYVSSAVENGTCHDMDTSSGAISVRLSKGKLGEAVYFVNSNGSLSKTNPLKIQADDAFIDGSKELTVAYPYSRIECWCVNVEADGTAVWNYSISSMFGNTYQPLQETFSVSTSQTTITICSADAYAAVKLFISAGTADGQMRRTSEVLLMIDNVGKQIYETEYAVLKIGDNGADNLFVIAYTIDNFGNVVANVSTTIANVRFTIQTLATQAFGVAQ